VLIVNIHAFLPFSYTQALELMRRSATLVKAAEQGFQHIDPWL
jgi:hypothetical protein